MTETLVGLGGFVAGWWIGRRQLRRVYVRHVEAVGRELAKMVTQHPQGTVTPVGEIDYSDPANWGHA